MEVSEKPILVSVIAWKPRGLLGDVVMCALVMWSFH